MAQKEMCCNGGYEAQSESGARGTTRPSPEPMERGLQLGLLGKMGLMPCQSLSSFEEHPRSQKRTFDLALGPREIDPSDKEEEGTPDWETSRAKAWPCEAFRWLEQTEGIT